MNVALEQLLTTRASRDLHSKELDLNTKLLVCLNEVQATKAIKQATEAIGQTKVYHATTAYTLQQVHQGSVLELECQVMVEERWVCQAFMEAFGVVMQAYLPKNQRALLYPLQLLTSDMPLTTF